MAEYDVIIEAEDSNVKYQGRIVLKCERYAYTLTHLFKIYDLSLFKFLADILGFDAPLPPLATDFGKHTESFTFDFFIKDGDPARDELTLIELIKFIRFKGAYADNVYLYIGNNIKADGSRILEDSGKGITGKVGNLDVISVSKNGYIKCRLQFLQCIDLLNW